MATTVTFIVAPEIAEGATTGIVLGDFNNWNYDYGISLERQDDGSLRAIAALEPGRTYQYRYLLNDGRWVNDGRAQSYVPVHGLYVDNCVITVPEEELVIEGTFIPAETLSPDEVDQKFEAEDKIVKASKEKKLTAKSKKTGAVKPEDDLTKITGINKKLIGHLAGENIDSFKTLAKASNKKLKGILDIAGDKFAKLDASSWPKQANLAAAGSWQELEELQKALKAKK